MLPNRKIYRSEKVMFFILALVLFGSGCAPLLIGAGAVGGYHVAKHHDK